MTHTIDELLPCPFCGDKTAYLISVENYNINGFTVICGDSLCGIEGPRHETEEFAIKAWNTRAALTHANTEMEALKHDLERTYEQLTQYVTENETQRTEMEKMREALTLILPLAKGYAAANRVGSNQAYIEYAESLLPPTPKAEG